MSEIIFSKEEKKIILLKLSEEKKVFKCAIGDQKIKDCVDEQLEKIKYKDLGENPSKKINRTIYNCLEAMLLGCLRKQNLDLDYTTSEVEITMVKNKNTDYEIKEIGLHITLKREDEKVLNAFKNCLNFFNISCFSKKDVKFTFSFTQEFANIYKEFTADLLTLKKELEKIVIHEIKP